MSSASHERLSPTSPFFSSTLFSSSCTAPSRASSSSPVMSCRESCALIQRPEDDNCRMAHSDPPTGYEPNVLGTLEDFNLHTSIFHHSDPTHLCNLDDFGESAATEIDDHIRKVLSSQVCDDQAGLTQTYHSNAESLFERSQSISQSTGKLVLGRRTGGKQVKSWKKTESGLYCRREQLLSEAKSDVLKHESQTGIAENYIHELKNKVEFQEMEIRRANDRYAYFRSQWDPLDRELADRERALRDSKTRGIHELEALKRVQNLRVDEFSKRKNDRGSQYFWGTLRKSSGIAKRNWLYDWFKRFQGRWIRTQRTIFSRSQWTGIISSFSLSRRTA